MSLNLSDVTRLAMLARIDINDAQASETLDKLNDIFSLVETMQAVDTGSVEPLQHPLAVIHAAGTRLRADEVTETNQREALQKAAPATADGLYLVPRVIE